MEKPKKRALYRKQNLIKRGRLGKYHYEDPYSVKNLLQGTPASSTGDSEGFIRKYFENRVNRLDYMDKRDKKHARRAGKKNKQSEDDIEVEEEEMDKFADDLFEKELQKTDKKKPGGQDDSDDFFDEENEEFDGSDNEADQGEMDGDEGSEDTFVGDGFDGENGENGMYMDANSLGSDDELNVDDFDEDMRAEVMEMEEEEEERDEDGFLGKRAKKGGMGGGKGKAVKGGPKGGKGRKRVKK
jgi:hypothetical protein